jgi:hypothetical protein
MTRKHYPAGPSQLELDYFPERYLFVEPVFTLDDVSQAVLRELPSAEEHAFYGYPRAVQRILDRQYLSEQEMEAVLAHNAGRSVPPIVQAYREALMQGRVKRQRGRKPPTDMDERWLDLAHFEFRRTMHWLQKRRLKADEERRNPENKAKPRRSPRHRVPWKDMGPYELAVLVIARRFYHYLEPKTVQNMLSRLANPPE